MRYNETQVQPKPEPKKEKPREITKPGQYTPEDLINVKHRPMRR